MKQSTFVSGRNIFDGVLVVNKILDLAKREKYLDMLLKIDFKRAYDCISWRYLRFMLIRLGFGVKRKSCMKAIVFPNTMSVLGSKVNKDVAFDTLQFANDTIFLGECNWTNLWSVKAILQGFKEGRSGSSRDSIWWRDLVSLGHNCGQDFNLFTDNVKCDLSSGLEISFWNNKWMGTQNLKESFPGLFVISRLSFGNVTDMGEWTGSNWSWNC
ncbi:hypothetical protein KIW84_014848 [Lathyrus oleraceus]|uniref:Reverse transcriptase domain-containing protein n=1 Tax=Pisum sativum TaxID=3888 RepID=A0A9D5BPH7_PEA|nr:hypothetical protein KIW84_014848 [Pisum sativum]